MIACTDYRYKHHSGKRSQHTGEKKTSEQNIKTHKLMSWSISYVQNPSPSRLSAAWKSLGINPRLRLGFYTASAFSQLINSQARVFIVHINSFIILWKFLYTSVYAYIHTICKIKGSVKTATVRQLNTNIEKPCLRLLLGVLALRPAVLFLANLWLYSMTRVDKFKCLQAKCREKSWKSPCSNLRHRIAQPPDHDIWLVGI